MTQTEIRIQIGNIIDIVGYNKFNEAQNKALSLVATACQSDSIAFGEWLPRNAQPISNNRNWIYKKDRKEYTTAKLYALYDADKNKEGI